MSILERILGQCKEPRGRFGRFLIRGMNFGHSGLTKWGLGFIDIASDIHALDIGCGGGRTVERLAGIASDGKVVGIDYSPDAVVMTYLSIEELREVLEGAGFPEFDALEEKKKGWFAVKKRMRQCRLISQSSGFGR
ncbi:MAG: class I SAM-dependent methyltransferase [Sedimentisphaerales bacterium]|nr:class I SAM-dependent methyltransferase [Sedimentisphaerales bacterium]